LRKNLNQAGAIGKKVVISSDSMSLIMKEAKRQMVENITYNPKKLNYKKPYNHNDKVYEDGYFIKKDLINRKRYIYGNQYNLIYIKTIKNRFAIHEENVVIK